MALGVLSSIELGEAMGQGELGCWEGQQKLMLRVIRKIMELNNIGCGMEQSGSRVCPCEALGGSAAMLFISRVKMRKHAPAFFEGGALKT